MASVRKQLNLDRCWIQWNAMHSTTIAFSGNHRGRIFDWWFEQTHYPKFKWQIQPMMQYNDWNGFVSLDFRKTDDNDDIRHRHSEPFKRIRIKFRQLSEAIGVSSDLVCKRFEIVWNFGESLEFDPKMSPLIISTLTDVWSIEFRVGHRCLIKIIKAKQNDYCNSSLVGRADGEKIASHINELNCMQLLQQINAENLDQLLNKMTNMVESIITVWTSVIYHELNGKCSMRFSINFAVIRFLLSQFFYGNGEWESEGDNSNTGNNIIITFSNAE